MKKIIFLIALLVSFGVAADFKVYDEPKNALDAGKQEGKKVIMFIYTNQCPWCAKMKKETFVDEKLSKIINEKYIFNAVDQDRGLLPPNLNPQFVPMTYVVDTKINKVTKVIPGFVKADKFIEELAKN